MEIKKCNCESKFQDELYGANNRVMNAIGKTGNGGFRCTVCGKEIKINSK